MKKPFGGNENCDTSVTCDDSLRLAEARGQIYEKMQADIRIDVGLHAVRASFLGIRSVAVDNSSLWHLKTAL